MSKHQREVITHILVVITIAQIFNKSIYCAQLPKTIIGYVHCKHTFIGVTQ